MLIRFAYTFCIYVCIYGWRALLETLRLFMLDAEPCRLFMWAHVIKGQGGARERA